MIVHMVLKIFQVKEIYNFTQDDLTTEDVFVLDCQSELYVWIGCHSNAISKQQALTFGLVFSSTVIYTFLSVKIDVLKIEFCSCAHSRSNIILKISIVKACLEVLVLKKWFQI